MIDYINHTARLPHPHDRGPDRVRARAPARRGEPARGRRRHRLLRPRAAVGAARGPRRDARGRDARPRDDAVRAHHRRDRPPRVRHAAHQRRRQPHSTASSTCSRPTARPRSGCSSPPRSCGVVEPAAHPPHRWRHGRRVRGASWPPTRCATSSATARPTSCATSCPRTCATACRPWRPRSNALVQAGVISYEDAVRPQPVPRGDQGPDVGRRRLANGDPAARASSCR